jgi:hypothetical protein
MTRVAATLAIAVVLMGCSPSVDSFSVHRFSVVPENQFPPLDRTVNDAAVASHLYGHVRLLRPFEENGIVFCALDSGARHELSFYARGERVLHGVMEMGCHFIDLGAGDRRTLDDSFEAELLGAIGLYTRGNDLWPAPIRGP